MLTYMLGLFLMAVLVVANPCNKESKREIPDVFIRRLRNFNEPARCDKVRWRSQPANFSLTQMDGKLAHNIRFKIDSSGKDFNKIELRFEITGNFKAKIKSLLKRKYTADVKVIGTSLDRYNLDILPTFGQENFLELTLDITSLGKNSSRRVSPIDLNLTFRFTRSGKVLRSLMGFDTKIFVILHERVGSCNFVDVIGDGIDFQRSLEKLRGLGVNPNSWKSLASLQTGNLCRVSSLRVNLADVGFKGIIAPEDLNIGTCEGFCTSRNSRTGYAFLKNAFNERYGQEQSSCRPSQFGGTSMIYVDSSDGRFVMAHFSNMVVRKCDCH